MEEKKPKAGERLLALETESLLQRELLDNTARRNGEMEMIIYNLSRESEILKDAIQLMYEKLDAVIALSNDGTALTTDNINSKVTAQKVETLENGVKLGLEKGNIEKAEVAGVQSLIVSRELEKNGEVINPRLQFMVGRLEEGLASKFVGKSVGEFI